MASIGIGGGDAAGVLKEAAGENAEDEAANVSEIGDTAGLHVGDLTGIEELGEEPESDEQRGGDKCDSDKDKNNENRANAVARIGDDKCAHDGGNGSAGAEVGHGGAGAGENLGKHGDKAAGKVEEEITGASHGIFDLGSKGP